MAIIVSTVKFQIVHVVLPLMYFSFEIILKCNNRQIKSDFNIRILQPVAKLRIIYTLIMYCLSVLGTIHTDYQRNCYIRNFNITKQIYKYT